MSSNTVEKNSGNYKNSTKHGSGDYKNSAKSGKGKTNLLDLPLELRLEIYRFVLVTPSKKLINPWPVYMPRLGIDILCTCRQIYREACPVLYGDNRFLYTLSLPRIFSTSYQLYRHVPYHFLTRIRLLWLEISDLRSIGGGVDPLDHALQPLNSFVGMCSLRRLVVVFIATKMPLGTRRDNSWIIADEVVAALCHIRVKDEIVVKYRTRFQSNITKFRAVSESMAAQKGWAITEHERDQISFDDHCPRLLWSLRPTA